jgi:hypothetical protein
MRLSLRDPAGKETDSAFVADGKDAPAEAMMMLARCARLDPGHMLSVDDGNVPQETPDTRPDTLICVTAGNVQSLISQLEHRAIVIEPAQPLSATDLRLAASLCRHFVKCGWIVASIVV